MRPIHQKPIERSDEEKEAMAEAASLPAIDWKGMKRTDIRLVLQRLYYSRLHVLTKAVQNFAKGFREGMDEVTKRKD